MTSVRVIIAAVDDAQVRQVSVMFHRHSSASLDHCNSLSVDRRVNRLSRRRCKRCTWSPLMTPYHKQKRSSAYAPVGTARRATNTNKKAMLREHKPPPIRSIRISDFGLPDPKRDLDRHQNCISWSLSHTLQKISSKSVHKFASNPTDRQTDKQTDRQTNRPHRKHNLLLRRR